MLLRHQGYLKRKGKSFQQMVLQKMYNFMKKKVYQHYLILYSKINLRWIIDLDKKKLKSSKNIGDYLHKIKVGKYFLNRTEKNTNHKEKIKNLTLSKLKTSDYQKIPAIK